jgi:predicted ATPase/DNA-binding winged helix-turn-helix (wHTH) protein
LDWSDQAPPREFAFGPFRLSVSERLIERSGEPVPLGGRAMDILIALVQRPGQVVSQRELVDLVWPSVTVDDGNLRFHIATLRKALGDGVDGARYVINVPGRGYCFVSPLSLERRAQSVPSERPGPVLPARLKRMVGRDGDLEVIATQLANRRFVTIAGPGGIGKSTVAVALAHAVAADYGGACFVDLGQVSDPYHVPISIAAALGVVVQPDKMIPRLVGYLTGKRILLILDGCEHVIEAAAAVAEAIFQQTDEVHILATSREILTSEGEQVHRLAPLTGPPADTALTAAESLAYPAAQLFADRASASADRFVFDDADAPAVARICQRLDGIALAIELAAGRVEALGIEGVEALLGSRLSLLWQGRRTAPPRHQTLNATLDWSYGLLPAREQMVLRRLAVFAGPFTLDAAEAVAGAGVAGDGVAKGGELGEPVASLVAKSLIVSDNSGGRVRFRLLDTTRAYLQGKLTLDSEATAVALRHATFFCQFLRRASAQAPAFFEARALAAFGEHLGNIRAGLRWSLSATGDPRIAADLAAAAAPLFLELSLLTECACWSAKALTSQHAPTPEPRIEMELQAALGLSLMFTEGNGESVRQAFARALGLAESLGEFGPQLRLVGALHHFHTRIGDFRGSVGVAKRAVAVSREMDDAAERTVAAWMLGTSHHLAGDQVSALIHCREALPRPLAATSTDTVRFGFDHRIRTLCALARAQWLCGAVDEATEVARYTVAEAEAFDHPVTLCIARIYTVFVFLWRGDLADAEAIIEALHADTLKYSLAPYQAVAQGLAGELALRRGDAAAALSLLSGSLPTLRAERHEVLTSVFSSDLAQALAIGGRLDAAVATISEAVDLVEGRGGGFDLPEMLRLKGELLAEQTPANAEAAERCLEQSLALARRQGALSWQLRTLTTLARLRREPARRAAALAALAAVYAEFNQGLETIDLRAARSILEAAG